MRPAVRYLFVWKLRLSRRMDKNLAFRRVSVDSVGGGCEKDEVALI